MPLVIRIPGSEGAAHDDEVNFISRMADGFKLAYAGTHLIMRVKIPLRCSQRCRFSPGVGLGRALLNPAGAILAFAMRAIVRRCHDGNDGNAADCANGFCAQKRLKLINVLLGHMGQNIRIAGKSVHSVFLAEIDLQPLYFVARNGLSLEKKPNELVEVFLLVHEAAKPRPYKYLTNFLHRILAKNLIAHQSKQFYA
jgi:hypothetical protein